MKKSIRINTLCKFYILNNYDDKLLKKRAAKMGMCHRTAQSYLDEIKAHIQKTKRNPKKRHDPNE